MTTLNIKPRSKSLREINVNTTPATKISDILAEYAKVNGKSSNRIKLSKIDETGKTKGQLTLNYAGTVEQNSLKDKEVIYAKDLGPQIGWRTVYLIEYAGPMLINTIFYYAIYDGTYVTWTQNAAYVLAMLHFLKREYETTFVHSFSHATMPLFNIFKNCFHYWILSGVLFGITLYRDHPPTGSALTKFLFHVRNCPDDQLILYIIFWALSEYANYTCHIILRDLRRDGTTGHAIPYGFMFEYVTCPNYFFESLSWLFFAIITNNWSSWLFFLVGFVQMYFWAVKKHANLKKEFPQYPKNRKALIPFVV